MLIMKCDICERIADNKKLCIYHKLAYKELKKKYLLWQEALEINWKDYLSEIEKNSLTGCWAKEVIEFIRKNEVPENIT
jgi:hypothetical protein